MALRGYRGSLERGHGDGLLETVCVVLLETNNETPQILETDSSCSSREPADGTMCLFNVLGQFLDHFNTNQEARALKSLRK